MLWVKRCGGLALDASFLTFFRMFLLISLKGFPEAMPWPN
jgi:hypothetical protein